MHNIRHYLSVEGLSAILAWAVVSLSALWLMHAHGKFPQAYLLGGASAAAVFIVAFLCAIRETPYRNDQTVRLILMALQFIAIMIMAYFVPYTYIAILVTIWSAQVPYFVSFSTAILLSPLWSLPIWIMFVARWEIDLPWLSAALFWTFNIFSLVMVNSTIKEKRATEEALALNRELRTTQVLLNEATKQGERVRIARNIHDLLGHHLTALTINLQVAARMTEGETQQRIEQCHNLAKLLLSDVREAVSEIREKSSLALDEALQQMIQMIPELQVKLDLPTDLVLSDVHIAEVILRCIQESMTNSLKHGKATQFEIRLQQQNSKLRLELQDNGQGAQLVEEGNGLKGMRERITQLGGALQFQSNQSGFFTSVVLPEAL